MNYKIILTALAAVIFTGSLLVFGISRTVSNPNETTAAVKSDQTQSSEKEISVPITKEATNNSVETVAVSANPSAPPTIIETSPTPVKKSEMKAEIKPKTVGNEVFDGEKIVKTDDEWRKLLTAEQFHILREKGTERAYTGAYTDNKKAGEYTCAACGLALFTSKNKFDSQTGWISFYKPIVAVNVLEEADKSLDEERTEVLCARCNSHLGHVFDDGPEPTGLRYCINSLALNFKPRK